MLILLVVKYVYYQEGTHEWIVYESLPEGLQNVLEPDLVYVSLCYVPHGC